MIGSYIWSFSPQTKGGVSERCGSSDGIPISKRHQQAQAVMLGAYRVLVRVRLIPVVTRLQCCRAEFHAMSVVYVESFSSAERLQIANAMCETQTRATYKADDDNSNDQRSSNTKSSETTLVQGRSP